ncbi:MAG: molybdenum cofactor sulfurase [Deltaproteobacteria bacterium SM23_61]|nr:MAG: molybdenum cofactor sulfurase [Deltaproteobacteria bacterium SM23_61]
MNSRGKVIAVNISSKKGTRKKNVGSSCLLVGLGLRDDAHAAPGNRQVSLLAQESIDKMTRLGLKVGPGDFAENLTTQGLDLLALPLGTRFRVGEGTLLEVTQIGKVCHTRCAIYYQAGDCVMPKEGIFAQVLEGGEIKVGDEIRVLGGDSDHQ